MEQLTQNTPNKMSQYIRNTGQVSLPQNTWDNWESLPQNKWLAMILNMWNKRIILKYEKRGIIIKTRGNLSDSYMYFIFSTTTKRRKEIVTVPKYKECYKVTHQTFLKKTIHDIKMMKMIRTSFKMGYITWTFLVLQLKFSFL